MTARTQHRDVPPPSVRWRALLVLGLLAGLLAMHALAPGGAVPGHAAHDAPRHMTVAAAGVHDGCGGDDCGGGHVHHADSTCSSAAPNGGPTLPALAADPVAVLVPAQNPCPYAGAAPDGARAPPSLAELQLLRI